MQKLWLFGLFGFLLLACKSRPVAPVSSQGKVIAEIDDMQILDKDLLERISTIEETYPRVYSTMAQAEELLQQMINVQLLYEQALKQGLDKSFEFKSRLADLYLRNLSKAERGRITEDTIKAYYEANKNTYDQISARHILKKLPPNPSTETRKRIRSEIEKIYEKVLADPSNFAEIARTMSDDSSRDSGGELGYFHYRMMVEPFSKAAFALKKVGDISPIVESQYGFHIIQLTGDRRGLSFVRDQIADNVLRQTLRQRTDEEIARLRNGRRIELYKDQLSTLTPLPKEILEDPRKPSTNP